MHSSVIVCEPQPAIAPAAVVTARDVVRRYGEGDTAVDALRGVSVDVDEGRLTAVMGPSGSGKSTLMHILAGLDQPTSGEVSVAGVDIGGMDDAELTKRAFHTGADYPKDKTKDMATMLAMLYVLLGFSVVVSLFGALIGAALGLGLGLFLAVIVTQAAPDAAALAIPWPSLAAFTLLAALAGVGAAILPARRASKLNVLEALQYE